MQLSRKESIRSTSASMFEKKHNRSQTTSVTRPRQRSVRAVRESILDEYTVFKEDKTEKFMTNMLKLDYIIKNAKEISEILNA
jgi:hypothetical protein